MVRKYSSQLGRKIPDAGAHIPHVVVGLIRKRRTKKHNDIYKDGGSKIDPRMEYNPYPDKTEK